METASGRRAPTLLILAIGIIVGLLIAGGFVLVKSGFVKKQTGSSQEIHGLLLSISKPTDGAFVTNDTLMVTGTTGKDAMVAVVGGTDDAIVETAGGSFSANTKVTEGENKLVVYAFDPASGESAQTSLNILYLNETVASGKLLVAAASTSDTNQETVEKLRERLATKSAELKEAAGTANLSHVFGTITAINSSTLTVETGGGVKTVFTDDLTRFFSIGSSGKSTIALTDLKLGDNISAVGIAESNTGGNAKFIVRIEQPLTSEHAVAGKVKSANGPVFTLSDLVNTNRFYTIKTSTETKIKVKGSDSSAITDIKIGDVAVVCGTVDKDGSITAKRLFDIPVKPTTKPTEATPSATPSANP